MYDIIISICIYTHIYMYTRIVSKTYRTMMPKGSVRASSFGIIVVKSNLNVEKTSNESFTSQSRKNILNYTKTRAKGNPETSNVQGLLRKVTLRNRLFYQREAQKLEDETSTCHHTYKIKQQTTISKMECKARSTKPSEMLGHRSKLGHQNPQNRYTK